ncbi:MAG TPA: hypothetical protein VET48_11220, partial [Steroidobacteraceae bacterium]|nr:hypothetical protein [Steroidobacteraceae bacterium]
MRRSITKWSLAVVACCIVVGCNAPAAAPHNKGVYLLLDTSGTYNNELKKAQSIILYILSRLEP